jgi:hypothetical protein
MGFNCLRARASELERDFAHGCVRQLLEPAVATATAEERDRMFGGAAALALRTKDGSPEPALPQRLCEGIRDHVLDSDTQANRGATGVTVAPMSSDGFCGPTCQEAADGGP